MREKLETLPVAELREMAKAQGLKGVSSMRKAELIEQLCQQAEKKSAGEAGTGGKKAPARRHVRGRRSVRRPRARGGQSARCRRVRGARSARRPRVRGARSARCRRVRGAGTRGVPECAECQREASQSAGGRARGVSGRAGAETRGVPEYARDIPEYTGFQGFYQTSARSARTGSF